MVAFLLANCAAPQATPTPTAPALGGQSATSFPPQASPGASVTTYQAFASGLASVFTKGNICSLELPFELEGDALPVSSGLVASFTPTGSTQGTYTYANNVAGECVDSSNGSYQVVFYALGEGDIIMTGPTTRICGGVTVFNQTTESRIAIREAPGIPCP